MNQEQKYTSLELSKKIYELTKKKGIELESECWWDIIENKLVNNRYRITKKGEIKYDDYIPALDTAELGEILPITYLKTIYHPKNIPSNNEYKYTFHIRFFINERTIKPVVGEIYKCEKELIYTVCSFVLGKDKDDGVIFTAKTEAEARGLLYFYLLENNLIS